MKILTVTNMWPIPEHQYYGIFVKEQVEGLQKYFPEIKNKVWFINGFKNRINYFLSIIQINRHLITNKYDIIHIHFGLSGLFLLANPFIKVPIVTMLHGSDINTDKSNKLVSMISKLVVRRSNHVFYINDKIRAILKNQNSKLEYLPCGINTDIFKCRRVKNKTATVKVAFPASFQRPEKNYAFFCKVIDFLNTNYHLQTEIIEIHGKSRIEVCDILNSVDVLVMTSFREGSPQIIKEAMCCNTPIVTSNVGNVSVLLEKVNNCHVIDVFEEGLFCNAILDILNLKTEIRISNGRQRIFDLGLDEESTSMKIFNSYKSLSI